MEWTEQTIKELGAVGALIIGALWAGRFILVRMAGVLDRIHEKMVAHEERSSQEHGRMVDALDAIVTKANGE